jgi:hypothetical protein
MVQDTGQPGGKRVAQVVPPKTVDPRAFSAALQALVLVWK